MIGKIIKKIKYELQFKNPVYYRRIVDKITKNNYQRVLGNKIRKLKPIVLEKENADLTLAMLSNKRNFNESMAALYSFCFRYKNVRIHYHEDGTLTEKEFAILTKVFPGIEIFKRKEQNVKVNDHLLAKNLSHSAQLRSHFIFSLRTFDMIIEKTTPYLLQVDSDVLFFSRPDEIIDIVENKNRNGCYNSDVGNSYTFRPEIIAKYISKPVVDRFNAGLFMHNLDEEFFYFVENVLEKQPEAASSWHLEQTLFAMYVTEKGNFIELPQYYDLARRERDKGNLIKSEHYVHNTGVDIHKDFIHKLIPLYVKK